MEGLLTLLPRHLHVFYYDRKIITTMFKFSSLRPILSYWTTSIRLASTQEACVSYGNPKMPDKLYKTIELEMKSAEPAVLRSYETFILSAAHHLNINIGDKWSVKPTKKRWTLLRSVFVHRKHMVQYEVRTHYRFIQLHKLTGSTADTFLEYIERMLPEGVGLKVTKLSIEPLPSHLLKDKVREALEESGIKTTKGTKSEQQQVET